MLKKGLCVCPCYGCVSMWDCSLSFKLIADNYVALHLSPHLLLPSSWAGFKNDLFCEVLCLHTSSKWHTQSFTTHSPPHHYSSPSGSNFVISHYKLYNPVIESIFPHSNFFVFLCHTYTFQMIKQMTITKFLPFSHWARWVWIVFPPLISEIII